MFHSIKSVFTPTHTAQQHSIEKINLKLTVVMSDKNTDHPYINEECSHIMILLQSYHEQS